MMKRIPKLGLTHSAKLAKSLVTATTMPSYRVLSIETRLCTVEAICRSLYATLSEYGIYNGVIHAEYAKLLNEKNKSQKPRRRGQKRKCHGRKSSIPTRPTAFGGCC